MREKENEWQIDNRREMEISREIEEEGRNEKQKERLEIKGANSEIDNGQEEKQIKDW